MAAAAGTAFIFMRGIQKLLTVIGHRTVSLQK